MKKHVKIYLDYFYPHFGPDDFFICELTGTRAVDVHHIEARGMGGSKQKDDIKNLMGLARLPHQLYGDLSFYEGHLKEAHYCFMENRIPYIQHNPNSMLFNDLLNTKEYHKLVFEARLKHGH